MFRLVFGYRNITYFFVLALGLWVIDIRHFVVYIITYHKNPQYSFFAFEYSIACFILLFTEGIAHIYHILFTLLLSIVGNLLYQYNPLYCSKKLCRRYIRDLCICKSKILCFHHKPYYYHDDQCRKRFAGLYVARLCNQHNVPKDVFRLILLKI